MSLLINNKNIPDTNTTILYTSEYNYNKDAIDYLNSKCVVIDKTNKYTINDIPKDILDYFNLDYLLTKNNLTKIDKLKINILGSLSSNNNIYVFLNVLTYLDNSFKDKLIAYLKASNKEIINYTSDIEEALLLDYLIIINQDKIVIEGETKLVLQEEKIIKKLGFNLPFIVELSNGLKYYNLIDKLYFTNESLVEALWN
ncbi:MAG: hypothetical protein NC483_05130 [Ruminococcus sp.]|nr:hypothetical protein [Ruminococcus sp.]